MQGKYKWVFWSVDIHLFAVTNCTMRCIFKVLFTVKDKVFFFFSCCHFWSQKHPFVGPIDSKWTAFPSHFLTVYMLEYMAKYMSGHTCRLKSVWFKQAKSLIKVIMLCPHGLEFRAKSKHLENWNITQYEFYVNLINLNETQWPIHTHVILSQLKKKCICFILELYTTDLGDVVVAVLL